MARKTYNALIALIVSNIHTSKPIPLVVLMTLLTHTGEAEDKDYFLHPENTASFKQVIANLHLACFWFSAPEIGAASALRRTKTYLDERHFAPSVRSKLEEAVHHLEIAIQTPGWDEWMRNAVSLPFEAAELSPAIRSAWSDSPSDSVAIDTHSLLMLREANTRGNLKERLLVMGGYNHAAKLLSLDPAAGRKGRPKHKSGGDDSGVTTTAASQPAAVSTKASSAKRKRARESSVDIQLDEAALNANRAEMANLPRPLPDFLQTTSRSVKINFVIRTILDADPSDQFVIFGDSNELGHLTEALELFEITS